MAAGGGRRRQPQTFPPHHPHSLLRAPSRYATAVAAAIHQGALLRYRASAALLGAPWRWKGDTGGVRDTPGLWGLGGTHGTVTPLWAGN